MKNRLNDPIVDEIHATRAKLAAPFGNDIDAIIIHAQAIQEASGRSCVRNPTRRQATATPATKREEESHT